jgi:hypothetical protein
MRAKAKGLIWARRLLLALPFATATVLTILVSSARHLHLRPQHVAGVAFLFGAPWGWLLEHGWFGNGHSLWLEHLIGYAVILWVPAVLYSASLWLLLRLFGLLAARIRTTFK